MVNGFSFPCHVACSSARDYGGRKGLHAIAFIEMVVLAKGGRVENPRDHKKGTSCKLTLVRVIQGSFSE